MRRITSGCPEKRAKMSPPAAWEMIVFCTVRAPLVVVSFREPKAIDGRRQAKNKNTVAEIDFEIDFKLLNPSTKSEP